MVANILIERSLTSLADERDQAVAVGTTARGALTSPVGLYHQPLSAVTTTSISAPPTTTIASTFPVIRAPPP